MNGLERMLVLDWAPRSWGRCTRSLVRAMLQAGVWTIVLSLVLFLVFEDWIRVHRVYVVWDGKLQAFGEPPISKRRLAAVVGASGVLGLIIALGCHWRRMFSERGRA
jgi:hypothetical protein